MWLFSIMLKCKIERLIWMIDVPYSGAKGTSMYGTEFENTPLNSVKHHF